MKEDFSGTELEFRIAGEGDLTIMFSHGFCGDMWDFSLQEAHLSTLYRTINCDMPGQGRSGKPKVSTIEGAAEAFSGLREAHQSSRNILVAHSMGCRMALQSYADNPEGIVGIALVDGSRIDGKDEASAMQGLAETFRRYGGAKNMLRDFFLDMFTPDADPAVKAHVMDRVEKLEEQFSNDMFSSLVRWDITKADAVFDKIDVPVLIVQSTYVDPQLKRRTLSPGDGNEFFDFIKSHIDAPEIHIIPDVGHYPHVERADQVNAHLARFAERLQSS